MGTILRPVYFTRGFLHPILRARGRQSTELIVTSVVGCGAVFLQFANPPNIMATFNRTAIRAVAAVMSTELRALYNVGLARGLHCWGPVLDLARDPRQGRNGESGSESPFLTSVFATEHTLGFQNGSVDADATAPFFIGMSTLKHWGFNTVEDSDGSYRSSFNNNASNFTLQDAHLAPYRAAITKGGARGVMCSCRRFHIACTCALHASSSSTPLLKNTGMTLEHATAPGRKTQSMHDSSELAPAACILPLQSLHKDTPPCQLYF